MKKDIQKLKQPRVAERRSFLKGAAITTAVVGAGALASNAVADTVDVSETAVKNGYQETEHVKAYYKLARF
jgi:anaerobic selenocysteine-containing dehydrogenase